MTGASAVLPPACGLRGWPTAGAAGYALAQGERTSGRAAGGHKGTDAGGGKGRLNFLYSTLFLAVRGNIATRSMSGPPFAFQLHCSKVWCRATQAGRHGKKVSKVVEGKVLPLGRSLLTRIIHQPLKST